MSLVSTGAIIIVAAVFAWLFHTAGRAGANSALFYLAAVAASVTIGVVMALIYTPGGA